MHQSTSLPPLVISGLFTIAILHVNMTGCNNRWELRAWSYYLITYPLVFGGVCACAHTCTAGCGVWALERGVKSYRPVLTSSVSWSELLLAVKFSPRYWGYAQGERLESAITIGKWPNWLNLSGAYGNVEKEIDLSLCCAEGNRILPQYRRKCISRIHA